VPILTKDMVLVGRHRCAKKRTDRYGGYYAADTHDSTKPLHDLRKVQQLNSCGCERGYTPSLNAPMCAIALEMQKTEVSMFFVFRHAISACIVVGGSLRLRSTNCESGAISRGRSEASRLDEPLSRADGLAWNAKDASRFV
jgi:hypothetical protein